MEKRTRVLCRFEVVCNCDLDYTSTRTRFVDKQSDFFENSIHMQESIYTTSSSFMPMIAILRSTDRISTSNQYEQIFLTGVQEAACAFLWALRHSMA